MVVINRTRKDSCENSHVCYCSLLDNHGVQSGATNARCNLGQSRVTPECTTTLLSKQHVELFHTDRATRIQRKIAIQVQSRSCIWGPLKSRRRSLYPAPPPVTAPMCVLNLS